MANNFNILDFNAYDAVADAVAETAALPSLTNSTGQTPDATIENVPAASAASVDTSAASLASTNTALTALEKNVADLAGKINDILTALAV